MRLVELITALDRKQHVDNAPPPPPRQPRGERGEPKSGVYWMRASSIVPITGRANEIVKLSGQVVMLNPENYGLTAGAIMQWLRPYGTEQYSPANEYRRYLAGTDYDMSHVALLHKSSAIVYQKMLTDGWAWVKYMPPEAIQFAMIPAVVKRQFASAAEHFSLMQIDRIYVTLMTDFTDYILDQYPQRSKNKTLAFSRDEFAGFAGAFGGAMDWSAGGEAPTSNYLYFLTHDPSHGLHASVKNVKTAKGYRKRWGLTLSVKPPAATGDLTLGRMPVSAIHKINFSKHWDRGFTDVRNGQQTMFSDRPFSIGPRDVEIQRDGSWQTAG